MGKVLSKGNMADSKQGDVRDLLIAMMILPTVIVLIRAWSRFLMPVSANGRVPSKFWWDDWTVFIATAMNLVVCGLGLKLVDLGMGLHVKMVPPGNIGRCFKLLWCEFLIFNMGTAMGKISTLFFYDRTLSPLGNSRFRLVIWLMQGASCCWLFATFLCIAIMCRPITVIWDSSKEGTCIDMTAFWLGATMSSLLIDVIILVMPLPILWRLQMKTSKKVLISCVFLCGSFVVVVSIGWLTAIIPGIQMLNNDPTYAITTPALWLISEVAITVVSSSLPVIFFLFQRAYRQGASSLFSTRSRPGRTAFTIHNEDSDDQDEDADRLFPRYNGSAPCIGRTSATVQRGDSNHNMKLLQYEGIHVRRDIEVMQHQEVDFRHEEQSA